MFNIGWGEMVALVVIGVLIFGPDKLPRMARDAGRMLRQLRDMADGAKQGLRSELGDEFSDMDLSDLNPRTFVRRYVLDEDDGATVVSTSGAAAASVPVQARRVRPLAAGEHPPFDPDST